MKKVLVWFLLAVILACAAPAAAEEAAAPVVTVSFKRVTVPADTETVEMGKVTVGAKEYDRCYEFLSQLPNLKYVEMFSTKIPRKRIEELVSRFPDVEFGWTMAVGDHAVRTDISAYVDSR